MDRTKIMNEYNFDSIYFLMHKNIEVCQMEIFSGGKINKVSINAENIAHMPIGTENSLSKLRLWWKDREIPKTRNNVKSALERLGFSNTSDLLVNNLGLSLNDCYWIKPANADLSWEDINLFNNTFEDVFGDLTFNINKIVNIKDKTIFNSASSPGELQKKWVIDSNNKRVLIKGNYGLSYQQSINEVLASNLHMLQSFDNYVDYSLVDITLSDNRNGIGCSSYCFCNENVESISLSNVYNLSKKRNDESNFEHLKKECLSLGVSEKEFNDYFDYLILSDFLLTNVDRHLNNISLLRNPDTLKIIGFSPIYDTGNSMFYRIPTNDLDNIDIYHIKINSLTKEETKMLKFVNNRNALNLKNTNLDFSIYDNDIRENLIRKDYYIKLFNKKIELINSFQNGSNIWRY